MKKLFILIIITNSILAIACTKEETGTTNPVVTEPQQGAVKGKVTDAAGNPMPNTQVVIENTVYYASYVYATTNADGMYRAAVSTGSWKVSVLISREFLGKTYRFDLHPNNAEPFAATTGAIRNFEWKLSGAKPNGTGFYGSDVAVYSEPGSVFGMEDVEVTLTPEGKLIDGNAGTTITKGLTDIGGGEDGIRDVPIGKYIITARNKTTGKILKVRLRNIGEYVAALTATFNSGFTGVTNYKIVVQVTE